MSVELNGAWISRFPVNKGESEICCFRGMTPGTQKHIRVLKDVRAMNDDPNHLLQITGLRYGDGEFLPLPDFTPETLGAREHPGKACHKQAAEVLTKFLQSILK